MMSANTRILIAAGALLFILLAGTPVAQCTIYYVDGIKGNDSFSGTSPLGAFKTIGKATSVAISGDTINVFPSIYPERVIITQDNVRLEALPYATIQVITVPSRSPTRVGIEIDASMNPITTNTIVRGFTIQGDLLAQSDYGIYVHNDPGDPPGNEMSPTLEGNTILGCVCAGILINAVNVMYTHSTPQIRHNLIKPGNHTVGDPTTKSVSGGGILLYVNNSSHLNALVRSNRIFRWEVGIVVDDFCDEESLNISRLQCNVIAFCEWGEYILGLSAPRITNETVALSKPTTTVTQVQGIESQSPNTWIRNSIIWVPDVSPLIAGRDLVGFPPANIDAFSLVEDRAPGNNPQFVSPDFDDFHLLSISPVINVGDTVRVVPAGPDEIDYDLDGDPRILDPFRVGNLNVDLGADEYTTVYLDVILGHPLYNLPDPCEHPIVNLKMGQPWSFTVQGNPNDLFLYLLAYATPVPSWNLLFPDYGNMLASYLVVSPMMVLDSQGRLTLNFPSAFYIPTDIEVDLQGLVIDPQLLNQGLSRGAFTRRILLDFNTDLDKR